jgi:hypothetical protein
MADTTFPNCLEPAQIDRRQLLASAATASAQSGTKRLLLGMFSKARAAYPQIYPQISRSIGSASHGPLYLSTSKPSSAISGVRPETRSAMMRPQPHACVQPFEPCPTFR